MKKKKLYCGVCGKELLQIQIGAEKVECCSECGCFHPYSAYDNKTGKRNWGIRFKCPSSKWYNSHYDYTRLSKP